MILIVDDERSICKILSRFLKKEGYETEIANLGREAIIKFKKMEPLLVLLDIKLTDIGGVEVLRKMKEIRKATPVIMITGYMNSERVLSAFGSGACDCIFKPFDFDYLRKTIKSLIGTRK